MTQRNDDELSSTLGANGELIVSGVVDTCTAPEFGRSIDDWIRQRNGSPSAPLLDLSDVTLLTAAGVRVLLDTLAREGRLEIRPSAHVARVFEICKVDLGTEHPAPMAT